MLLLSCPRRAYHLYSMAPFILSKKYLTLSCVWERETNDTHVKGRGPRTLVLCFRLVEQAGTLLFLPFLMGPNSGCESCVASTLPTDPSPRPTFLPYSHHQLWLDGAISSTQPQTPSRHNTVSSFFLSTVATSWSGQCSHDRTWIAKHQLVENINL